MKLHICEQAHELEDELVKRRNSRKSDDGKVNVVNLKKYILITLEL